MAGKNRVFTVEFREQVVQRMQKGESVSGLHRELQIARMVLRRWRKAYEKEGVSGLRKVGRPPGLARLRSVAPVAESPEEAVAAQQQQAAARRIAELERKIGQQSMDLDFLRRAFKRVEELRRKNTASGGTASTERSET